MTSRRSYWYGRSRAGRWPLWVSWLLAPTYFARRQVRLAMRLRKDGVEVSPPEKQRASRLWK